MQESTYKYKIINYWRNIDKKFLLFYYIIFSRYFLLFSSTSFLAGERLNKDYYFFFKTFNFCFISLVYNVFFINY